MDSKSLILATDIGTSSTRCALFSLQGQRYLFTTSQQLYPLNATIDGTAELDPAIVLKAVLTTLTETLRAYRQSPKLRNRPIQAWVSTTLWHSLLGLDKSGKPITPIYTWADSRARFDAEELRSQLSEQAVHARTGCMLRAGYWPAKLAWLQRTQKSLFRRVRTWVSPADFIQQHFTDATRIAPTLSMVSATGMWNSEKQEWDQELQSYLKLDFSNQTIFNPNHATFYHLKPSYVKKFPELRETIILPAIGDGAAGTLGSGVTQVRVGAINFGTSAAMRLMQPGPYTSPMFGLFKYALDVNRWVLGGATSNAGSAREWALSRFRVNETQLLAKRSAKRTPLPTVLPFLHSERAPFWNENIPAVMVGLHSNHTAEDLLEAWIEATYLHFSQILDFLESTIEHKLKFIVSGGIAYSKPSVQWLCDVLGRPCEISSEREASLRGAAIYAIELLTGRSFVEPTTPHHYLKPQPQLQIYYQKRRKEQAQLEALFKSSAT